MSDLFGNHIVVFPMRRLKYVIYSRVLTCVRDFVALLTKSVTTFKFSFNTLEVNKILF